MLMIQEAVYPIWEWPFSWDHASWIVGAATAAALGVLAMDDYKLAKSFFLIAAADAWGGMVMWGIKTDLPSWQRNLILFVAIGEIGVLFIQSLRYVDGKKKAKESTSATQKDQVPNFEVRVNGALWGPVNEQNPKEGTIVTLYAQAVNRGTLATAYMKRGQLTLPSGVLFAGKLVSPAMEKQVIKGREGSPTVTLLPQEQFALRLDQEPPEKVPHGWVQYVFEDLHFRQVKPGTKISLTIEDIDHHEFYGTLTINSTHDLGGMYMPTSKRHQK